MKNDILKRTNLLISLILIVGFVLTAALSYKANYSASLQNIEQVSDLSSEGIYYQIGSTLGKPVNVSLTMANDSLLRKFLREETARLDDPAYTETIRGYLDGYRKKYGYDSVFLVSSATRRYYNFDGLDRVFTPDNPENDWYFQMLQNDDEICMNVDNDEVKGANNDVTVFVNCRIRNQSGETMGIVGVGVRIDNLQGLLRGYEEAFGVKAFLVDDAGLIQISTDHTGYERVSLFEEYPFATELREEILSVRSAGVECRLWAGSGVHRSHVVIRYIPELNWRLVVERDTGALLARIHRQLAATAAILLLIISCVLVTISYVIRNYNRQIVSLTRAIKQERLNMFEKAAEQLYENIYELDVTHNRSANRATEQYFASLGAPAGTPFDKALRIVAQKQIKEEFRQGYIETFSPENVLRAFEEGKETLQYEFMLSRDGENYYWMRITARLARWESDGSVHMLVYRQNIEAEKQRERRMIELAYTDEMTGMLTKTATERRIDSLLQKRPGEEYAFFIFDIDRFKQANDRFGHIFGDDVIRSFAGTIRQSFPERTVLGRIGGDEFVAFLQMDGERAAEKAEELAAALTRPHRFEGKEWAMSTSIGVALAPRDGADFASLYKNADEALYRTKERGRGGYTVFGR